MNSKGKEAVVYFKVLSQNLPERTDKTHENSGYLVQGSNQTPPKHKVTITSRHSYSNTVCIQRNSEQQQRTEPMAADADCRMVEGCTVAYMTLHMRFQVDGR
jgi:hypothetical protein